MSATGVFKNATGMTILLLLLSQVIAHCPSSTTPNDKLLDEYINSIFGINETNTEGSEDTKSNSQQTPITGCEAKISKDREECKELKIRLSVLEIQREHPNEAVRLFSIKDFNDYTLIYTIIKRTYADDWKNVNKIIKFILQLPWCNHQYAGFDYLFKVLKFNEQLRSADGIQFAYQLKKFLDGDSECFPVNEDKKLEEKVRKLKDALPIGIKNLIWNGNNLCIRSTKLNEYIYTTGYSMYDNERRRTYTWIPKDPIGPMGSFSFELVNNTSLFKIKSNYYNEHLYAAECCKYDKERRNVFAWVPKGEIGPMGHWALELMDDNKTFRVRNNHFDEYLYVALCCGLPNDTSRRPLFTWIPKGDIGDQGEFEILPCE